MREVVLAGNFCKFSQNETLKNILIETGERALVFADSDRVLGCGLQKKNRRVCSPDSWPADSLNILGVCLQEIRSRLKDESGETEVRKKSELEKNKRGGAGAPERETRREGRVKNSREFTVKIAAVVIWW